MQICGNIKQIKETLDLLLSLLSTRTDLLCTVSLSFFINNDEYLLHFQNNYINTLESNIHPSGEVFLIKKTDYDKIKVSGIPIPNLISSSSLDEPERNNTKTTTEKNKTKPLYSKTKTSNNLSPLESENCNDNQTTISYQPQNTTYNELFKIEDHTTDCMKANRPAVFAIKQLSDNYYLLFYRKSVYEHGIDTSFRKYLSQQPGTLVAYKYFCNITNLRSEFSKHKLSLRHNGKNELSHHQVVEMLKTFSILKYL